MGNYWLYKSNEGPPSVPANQVIVGLQYSHRLGNVSEDNLKALLTSLSQVASYN